MTGHPDLTLAQRRVLHACSELVSTVATEVHTLSAGSALSDDLARMALELRKLAGRFGAETVRNSRMK